MSDHGMHIFSTQSIRLKGVNAPEIFRGTAEEREAGQASKAFVEEWVASLEGEWPLIITTDKDKQSFNRYVADVYSSSTGESLATAIIEAGHGAAC